ncbi:MAG: RHS repeat-associated core domain-containing protein [Acidobacteria bacterium]|nr:RHS repeat-associated core domain-containing protein [Acidobacteriota bacterium]
MAEYSTIIASSQDAKVAYLTSDHLGSPRINTDQNGAVIARHDYHPFGEEIFTAQRTTGLNYSADSVRKQFTGYERDEETDLDFAQARMYANRLGRFTSVDPILMTEDRRFNPQSINLYGYTMNRPLFYTDPTGAIVKHPNSDSEAKYLAYRGWVYEQYKADPKKFGDLWATIQRLESSGVTYNISVADRSKYGDGVEGSVDVSSNGDAIDVNIVLSGGTSQEFSQNSAFAHELEHARQFDNGEWGFILVPDKNGAITINGKRYSQTTDGLDITDERKAWQAMIPAANGFDNTLKLPHDSNDGPFLGRIATTVKAKKVEGIIADLNNSYGEMPNRETGFFANAPRNAKGTALRPGLVGTDGRRAFGCIGGGCKW